MEEENGQNGEVPQKKGIKELKEALGGLAVIAKTAGKVFADGKVSVGDARFALDLKDDKDVLVDAFKGIDEIDDEIKDLDLNEAMEIVQEAVKVIKAFKEGKAEG